LKSFNHPQALNTMRRVKKRPTRLAWRLAQTVPRGLAKSAQNAQSALVPTAAISTKKRASTMVASSKLELKKRCIEFQRVEVLQIQEK